MNQFSNCYFAYAGNPVSLADPMGLTVNPSGGGGIGSDLVTNSRPDDRFDMGRFGGGGAISADGSRVDLSAQIEAIIKASIKDGTYGTSDGTQWNINHMLMSSGGDASFVSNPTRITSIQSNGGAITFSTPDFEVGPGASNLSYVGESNFYMHSGDYDNMYIRDHYYSAQGGGGDWLNKTQTGLGAFDLANGGKEELINYAAKYSPAINELNYVKAVKVLGKGLFAAQAGISLYQAGNAFYKNNDNKWGVAGKASLDITIGAISVWGGPVGWAVGGVYFIGDAAGWWGNWGQAASSPFDINKR